MSVINDVLTAVLIVFLSFLTVCIVSAGFVTYTHARDIQDLQTRVIFLEEKIKDISINKIKE